MSDPRHAHLVANARFHDTDFARLELLKLLGEIPEIRTTVATDFSDIDALTEAEFLITYTCDLRPTDAEQQALQDFVAAGGRWIALHATNALLDFSPDGARAAPGHDTFMETLGSRFLAHPEIEPYTVTVSDSGHPLVRGMDPFEADDELYLCEYHGDVHPLLETRYVGTFRSGYVDNEWHDDEPRLVAYLHPVGAGTVLYITLGHCCGKYDMRPIRDVTEVLRGSWESPAFVDLLRRSISWALGQLDD
ncbi:MAG: ThuA domain-containing protein [Acidimicrobiia bacterium]|nr:ThuA domain-containing protein [Acidimicrobiia bacterium]